MSLAIFSLFGILMLSTLGGWWMSRRKLVEKPVKVMMFVGYFWLLTFIQLLLFAIVYFLWQRFPQLINT